MSAALASTAREPERFVLQLATAAEPSALQAWLTDAADGARVVYACGLDLPREAAGVVLVSRWIDEGLVRPFRQRDPRDARRWQFLIERTSNGRVSLSPRAPASPAASNAPGQGRRGTYSRAGHCAASARDQSAALMSLLRGRAAAGGACPTFAETVDLLGLPGGRRGLRRARYLFKLLADTRVIAVTWGGPGQRRVVTIVARGRAQGLSTASGDQS